MLSPSLILQLTVCLMVLSFDGAVSGQPQSRETAVPSKTVEETFTRFVAECVMITPGKDPYPAKFVIGSGTPAEYELPRRESRLDDDFRISKYETTQELFEAVTGEDPSRWKGPRNSVEMVSWQDATRFCQKLTVLLQMRKLIADDEEVRLPTALEWEYCCRAGTQTTYSFGEKAGDEQGTTSLLDEYAWHTGNAAGNDPAVGVLKPNPWNLHDVHGYLWEFVSDTSPDADLPQETSSTQRMIRGGSWRDKYTLLSSSAYLMIPEQTASDAIGFRCVIAEKPDTKKTSHR